VKNVWNGYPEDSEIGKELSRQTRVKLLNCNRNPLIEKSGFSWIGSTECGSYAYLRHESVSLYQVLPKRWKITPKTGMVLLTWLGIAIPRPFSNPGISALPQSWFVVANL